MQTVTGAHQLAAHIESLPDFAVESVVRYGYRHMGGTICDTILQAGLNYGTVVRPRVDELMSSFPDACTTTQFLHLVENHDLKAIIRWRDDEKPRRIRELTRFLWQRGLEEEDSVHQWLLCPENCCHLLNIKGIGPKTVDYLKMLVGIPSVAVDRHVRAFVASAGITFRGYEEIRETVEQAARLLSTDASSLDYAIWSYASAD